MRRHSYPRHLGRLVRLSVKILCAVLSIHLFGCKSATDEERIAQYTSRILNGDSLAYKDRASLLLKQGKYHDALLDYNALIQKGFRTEDSYGVRAMILLSIRAYDYAGLDFSECVALGGWKKQLGRGLCYMLSKEFRLAALDYRSYVQWVQKSGGDSVGDEPYYDLGRCDLAVGDYSGAIQEWRKIRHRSKWEIGKEMIVCYCGLGDFLSARRFLDSLRADTSSFKDDATIKYMSGAINRKLGRINDAREDLESVISNRPDFALAKYELALLSESLGDTLRANSYLDKSVEDGFVFGELFCDQHRLFKRFNRKVHPERETVAREILAEALRRGKILSRYQAEVAKEWMLATFPDSRYQEEYRNLYGSLIVWDEDVAAYTIVDGTYPYLEPEALLKHMGTIR